MTEFDAALHSLYQANECLMRAKSSAELSGNAQAAHECREAGCSVLCAIGLLVKARAEANEAKAVLS